MTADSAARVGSVVVVGAGIQIPGHLTLQSLTALSQCDDIFTILTPELASLLPRELVPKARSLWKHYQPGMRRRDAYDDEIKAILSVAQQGHRVAYLTVGNPVFFDSVTQGLLIEGTRLGIGVEIFSAVSAIDAIFTDLRQDVAPGCQIYDASSIVAYGISLRPDVPCLLLQPDLFGTGYVAFGHEPTPRAMEPLKQYLLRFYPSSHVVTYVTSAVTKSSPPGLASFALGHLGGTEEAPQTPGASLFIPAAEELKPDQAFVERMSDARTFSESYRKVAARQTARPARLAAAKNYDAVVLLSGGLDSAVLLHHMIRAHGPAVLALHMAGAGSSQETIAARTVAADASVDLHVIEMGGFVEACRSPERTDDDFGGSRAVLGAATLYMAALAFAMARKIPRVAIGLHCDDSGAWVEQTPKFLDLVRQAVDMVGDGCDLLVPFQAWSKADVIARGAELGVDLSRSWSCLSPTGVRQDGTCTACIARQAAFLAAGITDRTAYASSGQ
jgi:7-cyano-7-deazaguanine synthase in queuosine biosynthesis